MKAVHHQAITVIDLVITNNSGISRASWPPLHVFPDLVAECPQRTHAVLTGYDSLRNLGCQEARVLHPSLQYENAQIYTNTLLGAFVS